MTAKRTSLIESLWSQPIGTGVIDSDADSIHATVVAGDLTGAIVLFDINGLEQEREQATLPVWGVSHTYEDDEPVIAAALADKQNSRGGVMLRSISNSLDLFFPSPCWDVAFLDDLLIWTMWDGQLGYLPYASSSEPEFLSLPGPGYGLTTAAPDATIVVGDQGIFRLTRQGEKLAVTPIVADRMACYNVHSRPGDGLAIGGSSGDRPVSPSGRLTGMRCGDKGLCAIATYGDLLLLGSLDGTLQLHAPEATRRALSAVSFSDGIWNIAIDEVRGLAYVACGDGQLHCLALSEGNLTNQAAQRLDGYFADGSGTSTLSDLSNPLEIAYAATALEQTWSDQSRSDIESSIKLLERWRNTLDDDRINFLLGLGYLSLGRLHESIERFQSLSPRAKYFKASLAPLSQAFEGLGLLSTAVRVLLAHLELYDEKTLPEVLFRIGQLHERRGDPNKALEVYEAISYTDISFPGVREALARVTKSEAQIGPSSVAIEPVDVSAVAHIAQPAGLGSRRNGSYDLRAYVQYEVAGPADDAKKQLEFSLMESVLGQVTQRTTTRRALDVGCATGRWPFWIARRGFEAHGYDISPASIDLCRSRAASNPTELDVTFELHNLVRGALKSSYFSVVTCMMGTFCHISEQDRGSFLSNVAQTLEPNGLFAFSVWNASSPFCEFLRLDGQRAKEELRQNSPTLDEIKDQLAGNGLQLLTHTGFCYLPNDCYEVWEDDLASVERVREIDEFLQGILVDGRPQMYFLVAQHRGVS